MESTKIGGYDVFFPFKPYPLQKAYMSQVLKCLREKQNGLLESPTGTGKTLSLLCSTLSWLEKMKISPLLKVLETKSKDIEECGDFFDLGDEFAKDSKKDEKKAPIAENPSPKIFYSSRTHAQLSQACKEMKRSYYRHMSAVVMGGRDNLCINEEVMKLESNTAKTHACRAKVKAKQCPYHIQFERKVVTTEDFISTSILDIEDLNKLGMKHKVCPYYATRALKQKADVLFMPYNYLLDPSARKALGIEIKGNVIIFDEGHNIERMCEDSVSGQLKSETIEFLIKELKTLAHHMRNINYIDNVNPEALDALADLSIDEVTLLKDTLIAFQGEIEKVVEGTEDKKVHIQKWVFDVCERVGITFGQHRLLMTAIENIMNYTINTSLMAGHSNFTSFAAHLQMLNDFFLILFPDGFEDEKSWLEFQAEFIKKYRVFTEKESEEKNDKKFNGFTQANGSTQTNGYTQSNKRFKGWNMVNTKPALEEKKPWTLFLWCLSASISLSGLMRQGAHCIIITSGTLAPLNSFQIELETPFPVTLQNRHIIDETQLGIYIIRSSYNGITFNTCYDNRSNLEHIRAIGQSIVHFCKIVPHGVLLFFASYAVMTNMLKVWREKDRDWKIYSSLRSEKVLFEEPRDKVEFASCIEQFKAKIDEPRSKGAIFMGVCRGKLSEGLDMADKYCRGVIMVGLPFPATQEPRVLIKKQYLTDMRNPALTANDWYTLQMKRALNQAIGRIVRHKDDYGVVLLVDTRFEQHITGLSKWIQPYVKIKTYSEASNAVTQFFQRHEAKSKGEIILH